MSLRDTLSQRSDPSTSSDSSSKLQQRRGPPPVLSGGGGPGSIRQAQQDDPASSSLEMTLMRCKSLLKERHDSNIVDMILRDIVQQDLGVSFQDIAALETAKRLLNEAIVLPLMMPELFTGIRKPWKGVLLFGPPVSE